MAVPVQGLPMYWTSSTGQPTVPITWLCHQIANPSRRLCFGTPPAEPTTTKDRARSLSSLEREKCVAVQKRKDAASAWYLELVEDAVTSYLHEHLGFVVDAIPHNYLDQPPSDLAIVRRNHEALLHCTTEAFNPSSDVHKSLFVAVRDTVWNDAKGLGSLLADMKKLLAELEGADREEPQMRALQLDLQHLYQMRQLEQNWMSSPESGSLSDIVPVSGLVMGKLHRLLNEHKTVLEHWGRR